MDLATAPQLQPTRLPIEAYVSPGKPAQPGAAEDVQQPPAPPAAPPQGKIPSTGGALSQLAEEQYNLELSMAATLGFSVFTLKPDVNHDVLVYQAARYVDVPNGQGVTFRYGVAVEATIIVTTEKFEGGLTLPAVAANVQLGHSSASSDLAVRGYAFDADHKVTLPAWGSFDVDKYTAFQQTVDQIAEAVLYDNDRIQPVLLATDAPPAGTDQPPSSHRFFYKLGEWLVEKSEHGHSERVSTE